MSELTSEAALCDQYKASEQLDGLVMGTAEEERQRAKAWMDTAAQHCRNEEYWRERAKRVERNVAREKSEHQQAVEKLLRGIGHPVPDRPVVADTLLLKSQLQLVAEEFFELLDALTTELYVDPTVDVRRSIQYKNVAFRGLAFPDLVQIADACGDLMVVVVGMMSLCGIADIGLLREINDNNLLKLKNGKLCPHTGKFIKPPDHPKPNIAYRLEEQGWEP